MTLALNELLALERVQEALDLRGRLDPRRRGDGAQPEDLADHGRLLKHGLFPRRKRVNARGDRPLYRLRQRQVGLREPPRAVVAHEEAALDEHSGVLLGVERVAARVCQQRLRDAYRELRLAEQRADKLARLLVRERRERDRDRVALAAAPAGSPLEQLRAGGAEHEQGDSARPVDEVVDEVEHALVGPVKVLEDEHQRAPLGESLEEAPPGSERVVAALGGRPLEPDERAQVRLEPSGVTLTRERLYCRAQLGGGLVLRVARQDPRLRAGHFRKRRKGDTVAVGQAAAAEPRGGLRFGLEGVHELAREPRLPDPRN